jgi:hypothetical protein
VCWLTAWLGPAVLWHRRFIRGTVPRDTRRWRDGLRMSGGARKRARRNGRGRDAMGCTSSKPWAREFALWLLGLAAPWEDAPKETT